MDVPPRMISCEALLEQLQEYLDEDARAELCHAVEHHLTGCSHCRVYVDTIRRTVVLFHAEEHVQIPEAVADRLRETRTHERCA